MSGGADSAVQEPASEECEEQDRRGAQLPDEETIARVLAEARSVGRDLLDLARVALDRVRLGARDSGFRLLLLAWLGLAGATATVFSAYLIVHGLAGLLTAAFGGLAWAGRLVAGLLVLGLGGLVLGVLRGRSQRAELERLEARYGKRDRSSDPGETS
jgi:hypothetical protein